MFRLNLTHSRIIVVLCLSGLAVLSLRPMGFAFHFCAHLIHQRAGRAEQSKISLFRATHFNPAPNLIRNHDPERILDAVLVYAVLRQDPGEIKKYVSPLFPLRSFQFRYGRNPWFQGLMPDACPDADWSGLDRVGYRLLADPRANPVLGQHTGQAGNAPVEKVAEWLAVLARLLGNPGLASRLDPGEAAARLAEAIETGPAPGLIPRQHVLAVIPGTKRNFESRWRLFRRFHDEATGNHPGYAAETQNGWLLAVPFGLSKASAGMVLRKRIPLSPGVRRLRVVYLAKLKTGRVTLQANGGTLHELGDTSGKWQSADLGMERDTGTKLFLQPRLVLSGGGLVVVAGFWLTGNKNPDN